MNTLSDIKPLSISEGRHTVIAGPCSAESREQLSETAEQLAEIGIKVLRAGIWKPRTMPGCFEGVGEKGLKWLVEAGRNYGISTATEVATADHVKAALDAGIDILWIGARTTGNPFAVQEIADVLSQNPDTPILVKNPLNPDIELWIGALERLTRAGVRNIGAVHRGFSTHIPGMYRNEPLWTIPLELSVRYPSLTIIHDPSHIGGQRKLIAPLSQQALDMGFDGLIIESHCNPEKALSDARQQLTPGELGDILRSLKWRTRRTVTDSENLDYLRGRIDAVDNELLDLLRRRMEISREIGNYKKQHGLAVLQSSRFKDIISSRIKRGETLGLSSNFLKSILLAIHEESVRQQIDEIRR